MSEADPKPPLAGGRTARTRAALLAAGRALFAERPFDSVAIDDIVGAAGVAKGTFYNHFEDKEALITAIVAEIRASIEARILRANADVTDPPARIVRAACVYFASAVDDPAQGQILLRNDPRGSNRRTLNDGLRADLAAGLHSGRLLLPTIDAGLLYVIGVVHSLLLAAVRSQDIHRTVATAQQLCMLMLRAMGVTYMESELIASQAADDILRQRLHHEDDGPADLAG
jgi:AcrR family transcriptional regulator